MKIDEKARQPDWRLLATGRTALLVCAAALSCSATAALPPVVDLQSDSSNLPYTSTLAPNESKHGPAVLAQDEAQGLLNWANYLSSYKNDEDVPEVRFEPTTFFIANACGGRSDCRVLGWYADTDVIYVHESLADMETLFARSLLVHEFVHYLQHRSRQFAAGDCASFVTREREAYAVQQNFFVAYGAMPTIQAHYYSCAGVDDDATTLSAGR